MPMMPTEMSLAVRCGGSRQIFLRLLRAVQRALAVVIEHSPDDIFRHVLRQVPVDDAHDRHIGQAGIGKHMIDAGADRKDGAQIGQPRQEIRLAVSRPPHR